MDNGGDESGANGDNTTRSELLGRLGNALGMPVIALVSGWKGDHTVNLGEGALRAFLHVLDAELAAWRGRDGQTEESEPAEDIALFLVGRGGFSAFSEGVCRAIRGRNIGATVVIPERIDGALSSVALGAEHRLLHPYAAVGAYDRPPLGGVRWKLNAELLSELKDLNASDLWTGLGGPEAYPTQTLADIAGNQRQARLAAQLLQRLLADQNLEAGDESAAAVELCARVERQMSARALGHDLGLSVAELTRLGFATRTAETEQAALIWQLFEAYEHELQALEPPMPRYTESEVADEVEFAPAIDLVCGAISEGPHRQLVYQLDTGRPDPETSTLSGQWSWEAALI